MWSRCKRFSLPWKLNYLPPKTQSKTSFKQFIQTVYNITLFSPGVEMLFFFIYFFKLSLLNTEENVVLIALCVYIAICYGLP